MWDISVGQTYKKKWLGGHSQLNLGNRHSKRSLAGTFAIQSQFQSQQPLIHWQWTPVTLQTFPPFPVDTSDTNFYLWSKKSLDTRDTKLFSQTLRIFWTQRTPNFFLALTIAWTQPTPNFFLTLSIVWTQATQNFFSLVSIIFGHKWHQTFLLLFLWIFGTHLAPNWFSLSIV